MKNLKLSGIALAVLFLQSCGNKNEKSEPARPAHIASYELIGHDTINLTDGNGLKQGIWTEHFFTAEGVESFSDTVYYKDGVAQKIK